MKKAVRFLVACFFGMLSFVVPAGPSCAYSTAVSSTSRLNMTDDPGGFCDLRWGEPLNYVRQEYRTKFIGYQAGLAKYWALIPDAHGEMYLRGPVLAKACFYEGRLVSITLFMKGGFDERVSHISQRYGTPKRYEGLYTWEGKYTTMIMGQDTKGITLLIISNALKHVKG